MPVELWHLTLEDTIDTFGQAFLGLTLRCARCHDHKFDPVTSEDYYALYGIFDSTRYAYAGSEEYQSKGFNRTGFVPLVPAADWRVQVEAHARHIAELKLVVEEAEKNDPLVAKLAQLKEQIDAAEKQLRRRIARRARNLAPQATTDGAGKKPRSAARPRRKAQEATRRITRPAPAGCPLTWPVPTPSARGRRTTCQSSGARAGRPGPVANRNAEIPPRRS